MSVLAENLNPHIKSANIVERSVVINFDDDRTIRFEDCWLRDHCRCGTCYHAHTSQRALHILQIPDSTISQMYFDNSRLYVIWDDTHKSNYDASFLYEFNYKTWMEKRKMKPVLWSSTDDTNKVARVPADEFLHSVEGASKVFKSLLDYGVAFIEGVEGSLNATEAVCALLGGVQHTLFGGMWRVSQEAVHADTAYTAMPLAVHNDNTYFTQAAGLQILHCLEHTNGTGGETVLVDGFYGATQLREQHPSDFTFLTELDVEAEYIEDGHHHKHSAPVIQLDSKTREIKQIRFNVYDRSPMAFSSPEECRAYYRSLRRLSHFYEDINNQWRFKLTPGTVLVIDNFRVLHGRTAFTGNRVLCGCYVARSDWLDRARTLKLIH